jgi:phosphate transport system protein
MVLMARETLDRRIRSLLDQIDVIHELVEAATKNSLQALMTHDIEMARRIYLEDSAINTLRFNLEGDCMITIATQQPIMATDLRKVASILEVVNELERMGDYAKGIAKICVLLGEHPQIEPARDLERMGEITVKMLCRAVQAFLQSDIQAARAVPQEDDLVDEMYNKIYRDLALIMANDPALIDEANHLMWAAHNLERMADRVTNICERTIYVSTGVLEEIDISDDEYNQ